MSILGFTDLGAGAKAVLIDHDPTSVATDVPKGSLIIDASGNVFLKLDDGDTTNVSKVAPGCLNLSFIFQNNGAVLNTGVQEAAYCEIPVKLEVISCHMYGGPTGSIVVDLWKDAYANYPPTDADSIVASAPPTISSGVKSEDTSLTGWSKTLEAGSGILPNIDSVSAMTWAKVVLTVEQR